jgi:hypothetical protein
VLPTTEKNNNTRKLPAISSSHSTSEKGKIVIGSCSTSFSGKTMSEKLRKWRKELAVEKQFFLPLRLRQLVVLSEREKNSNCKRVGNRKLVFSDIGWIFPLGFC